MITDVETELRSLVTLFKRAVPERELEINILSLAAEIVSRSGKLEEVVEQADRLARAAAEGMETLRDIASYHLPKGHPDHLLCMEDARNIEFIGQQYDVRRKALDVISV